MTINELIQKLQSAKEQYGGNVEVLMECKDSIRINNVVYSSYTDPEDDTNNIVQLRLTDASVEHIEYLLEDNFEDVDVELIED